jgi:hypothetical protein
MRDGLLVVVHGARGIGDSASQIDGHHRRRRLVEPIICVGGDALVKLLLVVELSGLAQYAIVIRSDGNSLCWLFS